MVKNLQCVRPGFHPWVGKIPQEEGMATHSSILAWKIPMDRGAWQSIVLGVAKSWTCTYMTLCKSKMYNVVI